MAFLSRFIPRPAVASALLLLGVAGCVRAPEPTPPPQPPRTVPVPPRAPAPMPLAEDWRDWALSPGTWTHARDARGSRALFGVAGRDAAMVLRCDAAERRMFLSIPGTASDPVTIRTTSITRALPLRPTGGTPPYVAASLAPTDSILDAMAFSRGRFVVAQPGRATLVLPAWAEIGRVVEDCRG